MREKALDRLDNQLRLIPNLVFEDLQPRIDRLNNEIASTEQQIRDDFRLALEKSLRLGFLNQFKTTFCLTNNVAVVSYFALSSPLLTPYM